MEKFLTYASYGLVGVALLLVIAIIVVIIKKSSTTKPSATTPGTPPALPPQGWPAWIILFTRLALIVGLICLGIWLWGFVGENKIQSQNTNSG